MLVKEYFETMNKYADVTFIKVRARKDANTPFYHPEYQTTPTWTVEEWKSAKILDSIILNHNHPQIEWLCGGYLKHVRCMLIISPEDFELLYPSAEQRQDLIEYIDKKINE